MKRTINMRLNKIILLALLAGLNSQSFATEIKHGRILKEKSWSTDGSKVMLRQNKGITYTSRENDGLESQATRTFLYSVNSKVGVPVTIDNRTYVYLVNQTATNQTYRVLSGVCAKSGDKLTHCSYHEQMLELEKNGHLNDDTAPQLTLTYDAVGTYETYAFTAVYSDIDRETVAMSMNYSDITIS